MKKLLAMILAATFMISLLSACGSSEEAQTTTAAPASTAAQEANDSEDVDAVTTASIVSEGDALIKGLGSDGTWIVATLNDIVLTEDLIVDGEFTHRDAVDRKLGLYTQDENRNITAQFSVTAPKMIVKSPNFRLAGGTFKGDVYVEANGFKLDKSSTVDGDIYFASKEQLDTFSVTETSVVTGKLVVADVDVVSTASIVTDVNGLVNGLSADGVWLVAVLNNMSTNEDIIVEGEFIHREEVARKLALYTQDEERNITASFTLSAPKMIVKSENFKIQGGTFVGDVYVEANGFRIQNGSVDGNVYFTKQEYMDSMVEDETGTVTGEISVQ